MNSNACWRFTTAHYIYLAPGRGESAVDEDDAPPEANEFVHLSWEWVADKLQSFLAEDNGAYPARTTAQIDDFIDTIRTELTMTDYQENQQEKVELYVEHYDEISEAKEAFDDSWEDFTKNWGKRLAEALDAAEIVEDENMPDEYVAVQLEMNNGERKRWTLRQGSSDWGYLIPWGWWTKLDESRPIYDTPKPNARVGFLHRLDHHRDHALKNHELIFYLRNSPSGHDEFYHNFAQRFNDNTEIPELLPTKTTRPGRKSNVLEARYAIEVESHDDFFEAYLAALVRAMEDHVVSNPDLVGKIENLYNDTIEENVSL